MRNLLFSFTILVSIFASCGNNTNKNPITNIPLSISGSDSSNIAVIPLLSKEDSTFKVMEYKSVLGLLYDNYDLSKLESDSTSYFKAEGVYIDRDTLVLAVEMYFQGWRYVMPMPKSPKAKSDCKDGRTTWWKGYWYNINISKYSEKIPKKQLNGIYFGNFDDDFNEWRYGGSPNAPSKIEWLLSIPITID